MGMTLREGDREYFYKNLDLHFPGLKKKYQQKYGLNYEIPSDNNNKLMKIYHETCRAHNIIAGTDEVFKYLNTADFAHKLSHKAAQLSLF